MSGLGVRSFRTLPRLPSWLPASLVLLVTSWAAAQPPPDLPLSEAPARAPPVVPGLVVVVHADDAKLDPYTVRRAIEKELGVVVLSVPDERAAGTLTVETHGAFDLEMTYDGKDGRRNSRSLKLPADPQKRIETVALVAGNLARDETGELIEELRPPTPPAPPATPSASEPGAQEAAPPEVAKKDEPKQLPPKQSKPARPPLAERVRGGAAREATGPDYIESPVDFSLFHPISLYPDSEKRLFFAELGFVYSRVGAIEGADLTLFVSRIDGPLFGVQLSAIGASSGSDMQGASIAGLFSYQRGDADGVVVNGIGSYASGSLSGARVAGVGSWQSGALKGVQAAGVANVSGTVRGATVAGVTNVARGSLQGLQLAGVVNVAQDVDGVQIGLVNVGRHVRGLQLGLVNVASEVDGASLALVPIVGSGRQRLVFWSAPGHALLNVAAKFENGAVYTLLGMGYQPDKDVPPYGSSSDEYLPTAALGAHASLGPVFVEADVQYQSVQRFERGSPERQSIALRPKLGWQPFDSLGVFAGLAAERRLRREENLHVRGFAGFQVF